MNELLKNQEPFIRVTSYLTSLMSAGILDIPNISKVKPMPTTLYASSAFSAGGTTEILTTNVVQEQGVTNFDGNRLEKGRNFVVTGVTVLYGEDETNKRVWEVDYTKELPSVLKNSSLIIRQENEPLLEVFIKDIDLCKTQNNKFKLMEAFALIKESYPVELLIKTPLGSSITPEAGKKAFVQVLLQGFETKTKR